MLESTAWVSSSMGSARSCAAGAMTHWALSAVLSVSRSSRSAGIWAAIGAMVPCVVTWGEMYHPRSSNVCSSWLLPLKPCMAYGVCGSIRRKEARSSLHARTQCTTMGSWSFFARRSCSSRRACCSRREAPCSLSRPTSPRARQLGDWRSLGSSVSAHCLAPGSAEAHGCSPTEKGPSGGVLLGNARENERTAM